MVSSVERAGKLSASSRSSGGTPSASSAAMGFAACCACASGSSSACVSAARLAGEGRAEVAASHHRMRHTVARRCQLARDGRAIRMSPHANLRSAERISHRQHVTQNPFLP